MHKTIIKIIAFFQISLLISCNSGNNLNDKHYQIVVDAGSSGSRIYLYQVLEEENSPIIHVIQNINNNNQKIDSFKISGGIANYATQLNQLDTKFIEPFSNYVNSFCKNHIIENSNCYNLPIHILSTAGMRLLPESQKTIINNYIITKLKNIGFNNKQNEVTTITGWQEGLYSWLDINYLNNNLINNQNSENLIEVGGASSQLTFETKSMNIKLFENNNPNISENIIDFTFHNKAYHIYSISWLGLGQDQALLKMNNDRLHDACFNKSDLRPNANFIYDTCSNIYNEIVSTYNLSKTTSDIKPINHLYYAIGGIYYNNVFWDESVTSNISHEFIIPTNESQFIKSQCNEKTFDEIKTTQKDKTNNKAEFECANITYTNVLLNNIEILHNNQTIIKAALNINDHETTWTLGFIFANSLKII